MEDISTGGGAGFNDYLSGAGSLFSGAAGIISALNPRSETKTLVPNTPATTPANSTSKLLLIGGAILGVLIVVILLVKGK